MNRLLTVRILLASTIVIGAAAAAIGATFAYLSDTESSLGNQFDAGVLDLKIDNTSYYNGVASPTTTWALDDLTGHLFFDFHDLKPGDWGEDTISIHVVNNNAWSCMDSTLTSDNDVSSNEPELAVDVAEDANNNFDGELGGKVNFIFWADDGDNVLESDETDNIFAQGPANTVLGTLSATLADSLNNMFTGLPNSPLQGAQTYYIAKAWCFGALSQTPVPAGTGVNPTVASGISCVGDSLDNATQTDSLTADVTFLAIQSRDNADYVCDATPTPSPTPTPTPPAFACTSVDNIFASSSSDNDQGLRKDSGAILANRSIHSAAFGAPQTAGLPSDVGFPAGSFFSLGFPLGGNTASIVYGFSEPFFNGPGADFQIYEVTGGVYPDEIVKVEVSSNPSGPWTQVAAAAVRDAAIDMNPVVQAQYIKLTDVSNIALFPNDGDGYDLDAIRAFCTQVN